MTSVDFEPGFHQGSGSTMLLSRTWRSRFPAGVIIRAPYGCEGTLSLD